MSNEPNEAVSLCHDVSSILIQCYRDSMGEGVFLPDTTQAALHDLATQVARRLGPLIGGRYVPKRDGRAARDAAVWAAFTGRNHQEVMREFVISRRLLYSILARKRRTAS